MDEAAIYCAAEAQVLETARQRLLSEQGNVIGYLTKRANVQGLQNFLDEKQNRPLDEAVRFAFLTHEIDLGDQVHKKLVASLRHRILARTVTLPVHADDPEAHQGVCARLEWNKDRGGWYCKVPGNQAEADKWHDAWGLGPACRFWEMPNPEALRSSDDELANLYEELDKGGGRPT